MPNTKISNLTSAGTLTGSEVAPIVQSGSTVKATAQNIANLAIPSQAGQNGKYLTTDGIVTSWGTVSSGTSFKVYTANFIIMGSTAFISEEYNSFTGGTINISISSSVITINATGFGTAPFTSNRTYAMCSNVRTTTPAIAILGQVQQSTTSIAFTFYNTSGASFGSLSGSQLISVIVQTFA